MKKTDVQINATYLTKVTGKLVPVKITGEHDNGGWDGVNMHTNRPVRIKSPQRLRKRVNVPGVNDDPKPAQGKRPSATQAKTASKTAPATQPAKPRDTGERGAPVGKPDAKSMSLLDAAAHLLSLDGKPALRCQTLVNLAVSRGLWTPGDGKTPSNTLYASILREIKKKGDDSRFVKAERGKFALKH